MYVSWTIFSLKFGIKTKSRLSDRLTGILLFVASIFFPSLWPLFLTHNSLVQNADFCPFFQNIPIWLSPFFCFSLCCRHCCCCYTIRYSLLNFVSFINSNKLSIVLNMCYPRSQYTQCKKTLENFQKVSSTSESGTMNAHFFFFICVCFLTHIFTQHNSSSLVFIVKKMTYEQIGAYIIIHKNSSSGIFLFEIESFRLLLFACFKWLIRGGLFRVKKKNQKRERKYILVLFFLGFEIREYSPEIQLIKAQFLINVEKEQNHYEI